jgi:hypothetical protein
MLEPVVQGGRLLMDFKVGPSLWLGQGVFT